MNDASQTMATRPVFALQSGVRAIGEGGQADTARYASTVYLLAVGVTIVTRRVVLTVLLFVLGIVAAILHRLRDGSMSRDEDSRRSAGWRRDRRRIRPALARVADLRRRAGGLMNGRPRHARSRNTTGGTVDVQARATAGRREHGLKVAIMSP